MSPDYDHTTPGSDPARAESPTPSDARSTAAPEREVLSSHTSLDELFNAILGPDARDGDERGPLVETVEAQVREIRAELGLVEPKPEPPPSPKPLPEFVPVFRTQPPEDLSFSSAQGAQWTVARNRWSGLLEVGAVSHVPRPVLVAVPAAAILFAAGLYWGTTSGSTLPTPATSTLHAAPQIDSVVAKINPITQADIPAPTSLISDESTPEVASAPQAAPEPPPAPVPAPPPARTAAASPVTTRPAAAPRAAAPTPRPTLTPATLPIAPTQPIARASDTSAATPVATSGTNTPSAPVPTPVAPTQIVETPLVLPESAIEPPPATTPAAVPAATPPAPPAAPPATAAQPPNGPRLSREAVLVSRVPPVYPELARRLGTTGDVELDVEIDASGRVVRASSIAGPRALRDAAEAAVLQWRYQPQISDGSAVPSRRRVRVSFK